MSGVAPDPLDRLQTEAAFIRPREVGEDVLALVEVARAARDACDYGDAKRIRALATALARLNKDAP